MRLYIYTSPGGGGNKASKPCGNFVQNHSDAPTCTVWLDRLPSSRQNMHGDGPDMDQDSTRARELQALSFNPFGDSLLHESALAATDRAAPDEQTADEVTHRLEQLHIPSPFSPGLDAGARSSSNESSAVSTRTNPLFDGLDGHSNGAASSPGSKPGSITTTTSASSSTGSFLNPAADSYAPASSGSASLKSTPSTGLHNSSGSVVVSISMGAGAAPVRRHRLSSGSSVKSTRSRRSTNSSLSSIASKLNPQSDVDPPAFDHSESLTAGSNASTIPPPTARPAVQSNSSQDSMISLQPSVMSLETTSRSPPPVAGYRIPATGSLRHSSFPALSMCGPAFRDFDQHPIYVCSAILGTAIHPAKAGPQLSPPVRMSFAGKEILHEGRFDLLPITPE